tara:strand:- start:2003 stop:3385 length:1383 start_codon:yes stop_codon:yes gene_type:complete
MELAQFFDDDTMSVHLRENSIPIAKKGKPGNWKQVQVDDKPLTREQIEALSKEIRDKANGTDAVVEIERAGSVVIQWGKMRIVIAMPPFSDGWEITAVRPVAHLQLKDYDFSESLRERLLEQAEGILVAGSPGEGKTTFSRAVAEHFATQGKVVKTIESPRDMILGDEISQYSLTYSEPGEIHDVLLLSRPDNTFFDEMRSSHDFQLFTDLRLAGIGMIGVVHATKPVDAIQRFIGKIEMGIIPQVIDTVVFIKNGTVHKVLTLTMQVKVPAGMTEADLARPVITINDFETGKGEYELYTYGEQTVIVPVKGGKQKAVWHLAEENIRNYFRNFDREVEVNMISDNRCIVSVPERTIAKIIGKEGKRISQIENDLGISIDIQPLQKTHKVKFEVSIDDKYIIFFLKRKFANNDMEIFEGDHSLVTVKCSKKALIKIKTDSPVGRNVQQAIANGTIRLISKQ